MSETYWFTRYALTKGIHEVKLKAGESFENRCVVTSCGRLARPRKDLFKHLTQAEYEAEKGRKKRLTMIQNKLEKMLSRPIEVKRIAA